MKLKHKILLLVDGIVNLILNRQRWAAIELELGSAEIQIAEELFIAPGRNDQKSEN